MGSVLLGERFTKAERNALIFFLIILGLLLTAPAFTSVRPTSQPSLAVTIYPAFSFEPATLRVTVRIARNPENRSLEIQLDGNDYFSSSMFEQDSNSPVTLQFERSGVPAGQYTATAILTRAGGRQVQAKAQAMVLGRQ